MQLPQSAATAPESAIPDKLYFRIGEVSQLTGIKTYVLRYWETEFPTIAPKKTGTGHRLYRRKDVETVLEIKRLLYENRFTIEGARKALKTKPRAQRVRKCAPQGELFRSSAADLSAIRRELADILKLLS